MQDAEILFFLQTYQDIQQLLKLLTELFVFFPVKYLKLCNTLNYSCTT